MLTSRSSCFFFAGPLPHNSINAYISNCEQINHYFGLLHGDLFNSFDIAHPVVKGIDDFDVVDMRDSITDFVETFRVAPEAFIMLLLDSLQDFSSRRILVRTLKVIDEHGT
jgi:hypothetical protein